MLFAAALEEDDDDDDDEEDDRDEADAAAAAARPSDVGGAIEPLPRCCAAGASLLEAAADAAG